VRAAGESCGEEDTGDTGLEAVEPATTADASDQKKAACPPADANGQAAAGTPASPAPPASPAAGATPPPPPIGGALQQ
jgi:hypothetical protein